MNNNKNFTSLLLQTQINHQLFCDWQTFHAQQTNTECIIINSFYLRSNHSMSLRKIRIKFRPIIPKQKFTKRNNRSGLGNFVR